MTNIPFTLLLLLWLVVSCLSVVLLVVIARLPKFREFKDLEGKCAELDQRHSILEPQVRESAQLAAQLEQNRASAEILRTQVEKLELEKLQLEPLGRKVAELESKLSQKHDDLNEAVAKERNLREEIIRLEGAKKAEEEDVKNRRQNLKKLNKDAEELYQKHERIRHDVSVARKDLEDMQIKSDSIAEKVIYAESMLKELKEEYDNRRVILDEITEKYSQLKGECQALEKEAFAWIEQIKALKADHRNAGGVDDAEDPMGDLWTPYFKETRSLSNEVNEEARMNQLSDSLKDRGLVFANRTLNAFHTALKVADISPLTVLSGISGTGKSLLPRAYAETMGIHFLGLAVQPRWDSPQDMFGFYNYMEQKYKSTELARAMVQFEYYNTLAHGGDLKDQMLLVLLDEMNLARVEYYFSEFLSKLEVRRDIDPLKITDRQKVEIALEMGHGNNDLDEVRLYPDRNILFVGTMNEDESTQNLSDKVLDRSCVLRFGKPKTLQTKQVSQSSGATAINGMLSRETWMKWTNIGTQILSKDVVDTIEALNQVLDLAGKPFAHRVGKAIGNYVLNYPGWISGHEKIALADQVEQRILPKLRGLDVNEHHDAFAKLSSILADLDDPTLAIAFENGRKSNSRGMSSFIWRGVDRCED